MNKRGTIGLGLAPWMILLGCAGCGPSRCLLCSDDALDEVTRITRPYQAPPPVLAQTETEPATLDDLLGLASRHHPDMKAAEANIESARGRMIQAGLYPNPMFGPNFAQLGDTTNALGEPGARLSQTIVTARKLKIARAAGAHGVEAADWQAVTRWYDLVSRVRAAYFELLTARREQDTMGKIVGISGEAVQVAEDLEKAGAGNRPDVLRARVELEQNRLLADVSRRRVEAARQNLLTAVGRPTVTIELVERNLDELDHLPPSYDWKTMLECVRESSSELQEARALTAQQQKLLARAQAEVIPNLTVTTIPFYESPQRAMHVEVFTQMPIPIFDRNQGNIHAAQAELARSIATEKQVELRLTDRLTAAYQRYTAAVKQVESYSKAIVPQAKESLRLITAGYEAKDRKYDYTTVLQTQKVMFQAQLAQTQAIGQLWSAVIELAAILQQEHFQSGCGVIEAPAIDKR